MFSKAHFKILFLILIIGGGIASLLFFDPKKTSENLSTFIPYKKEEVLSLKRTLTIPILNIQTEIEDVGLTPEGNMDVPSGIETVGWYKLGAAPGEMGTAVFAGHLDGVEGVPGVFFNLHQLKKGDEIQVQNNQGEVLKFIVKKSKIYNAEDDTSEVFLPSDGRYLNLITCNGSWDEAKENYEERLVVFTELN